MTVKELLNKYDFYDYDKTGFESFAVFFPKDDFEKAKSFDIDYIDSIENHKELLERQLDLEVLYYKIMRADELEKTNTGKPYDVIAADTERDHYMSAQEAMEYGLIDNVITSR